MRYILSFTGRVYIMEFFHLLRFFPNIYRTYAVELNNQQRQTFNCLKRRCISDVY